MKLGHKVFRIEGTMERRIRYRIEKKCVGEEYEIVSKPHHYIDLVIFHRIMRRAVDLSLEWDPVAILEKALHKEGRE